jgi:hypothetical protein
MAEEPYKMKQPLMEIVDDVPGDRMQECEELLRHLCECVGSNGELSRLSEHSLVWVRARAAELLGIAEEVDIEDTAERDWSPEEILRNEG